MGNSYPRNVTLALLFIVVSFGFAQAQSYFSPVTAEELAIKNVPGAPNAPAVILFRQSVANDKDGLYTEHYRIKVLTDQGREYGNVEIPYSADDSEITELKARVISPEGAVSEFRGEVHEKVAVKKKGTEIMVKSFALPDVRIGSIVEYRYARKYTGRYVFPRMWELQSDLFTLRAHFLFVPFQGLLKNSSGRKVDMIRVIGNYEGYEPSCSVNSCEMDAANVPPFIKEQSMPAELDLKSWVKFIYGGGEGIAPSLYWPAYSDEESKSINKFIGDRQSIKQEAERVTTQTDRAEDKLRKIYERAQQLRNVSFEARDNSKGEKQSQSVEDVLRKGAGAAAEINMVFVALARALGFDAGIAQLVTREHLSFEAKFLDPTLFDSNVAWVLVDGKLRYFDPATKYCPFGLLPWEETGVSGVRLGGATSKGGEIINTPPPQLTDAVIRTTGNLKLDTQGALSGTISVAYERTEGLERRLANWDSDETARKEFLEKEMKRRLPPGASVKLDSSQGWDNGMEPLSAVFSVSASSFAQSTGNRIIFPMELLSEPTRDLFVPSTRVNPLYWHHPYRQVDEFVIQTPQGYSVEAIPEKTELSHFFGIDYSLQIEQQSGTSLRIQRAFTTKNYKFASKQYAGLRVFFQKIIASDQQQIVLKSGGGGVPAR